MTGRSGSQGLTALATTTGDDRPAGPGAHAQTETVNACPPTIVRLEGPLALGHGCLSLLLADHNPGKIPRTAVAQFRTNRRGPGTPVAAVSPHPGDLSRVLTALAQVKLSSLICWHPAGNLLTSGRAATQGTSRPESRLNDIYCQYAADKDPLTLYTTVDNHVDSFVGVIFSSP